mmetsp:Transcript_67032/g.143401  ORF Transcript_67032/g.143401 Transcript_67032/m.143401 type:complete len:200 (+) Transcript_67032:36-635(+)
MLEAHRLIFAAHAAARTCATENGASQQPPPPHEGRRPRPWPWPRSLRRGGRSVSTLPSSSPMRTVAAPSLSLLSECSPNARANWCTTLRCWGASPATAISSAGGAPDSVAKASVSQSQRRCQAPKAPTLSVPSEATVPAAAAAATAPEPKAWTATPSSSTRRPCAALLLCTNCQVSPKARRTARSFRSASHLGSFAVRF